MTAALSSFVAQGRARVQGFWQNVIVGRPSHVVETRVPFLEEQDRGVAIRNVCSADLVPKLRVLADLMA